MERLTLDGCALEHPALLGVQAVQPGREQSLDSRRNRDLSRAVVVMGEHREHLLEKERVAVGRGGDPCLRLGCQAGSGRQGADQPR